MQMVTGGAARSSAEPRCAPGCDSRWQCFCALPISADLRLRPQPTAKPSSSSRTPRPPPTGEYRAAECDDGNVAGRLQRPPPAPRTRAASSSPVCHQCFCSQPRPGRAEAMTKIANKPFIEAFSDAWAWCDFWARVAFSTQRCSSVPAPPGEQAGSWERPVPEAALGKCQPKRSSRDQEMPGQGTVPSLPLALLHGSGPSTRCWWCLPAAVPARLAAGFCSQTSSFW